MLRYPTIRLLLAGSVVCLAGCGESPTSTANSQYQTMALNRDHRHGHHGSSRDALVLEDPTALAQFVNSVSGDTVVVNNGGFGSAIALDPWKKNTYYLLTDRGPNIAFLDGIAFPAPDFHPQIGVFRREGGTLIRSRTIILRDAGCRPLTGLPIPPGSTGSTGEIAYSLDGALLPSDPNGIDSEGLIALPDGSFWVSDEYGPFMAHFNSRGCTIERIGPGTSGRALPLVLAKRRLNRGMEGLTTVGDGRLLVGMMQSPLDNPRTAGRASRLTRLVLLDTRTGRARQFAYLLENPTLANSDIASLGDSRFLVLERDGLFPGSGPGAVKQLFEIDLRGATDISDPANGATGLLVGGKTLEELTANAADPAAVLAAAGIVPVKKKLAVDILADLPGYPHDKVEGIALVDGNTVAVSNDDDFSVVEGVGGLTQKVLPETVPPEADFGEVVFVKLPRNQHRR